jgi:hypothetical protein
MADTILVLDMTDTACWQCGAPADAESAYKLLLVADSRRALDALGYPVKRGGQEDRMRVPVPRCANCRFRNRLSVTIVLGSAAIGAIVAQIVKSLFWPQLPAPAWLHVGDNGVGGTVTGVGLVLGFAVAVLCVALNRRLSGLRSLGTYPPVVALRRAGWHYPG